MRATRIDARLTNPVLPEVGSIYTVLSQWMRPNGHKVYLIAELDINVAYSVELFAILPDQDSEEMREGVREGIVNIETPIVCG